ncbi:MAG: DUF302 domain-containing protein [Candidatus Hodarchaeales archaeon]
MTNYEISKIIDLKYEQAIEKVTESLKAEGFGVLTKIDVKKVMKEKLDVNFEKYMILGACNPPLAKSALDLEREIGLLLPCNVIVQEQKQGTKVAIIDPVAMFKVIDNPKIKNIAEEVKTKVQRVIESL